MKLTGTALAAAALLAAATTPATAGTAPAAWLPAATAPPIGYPRVVAAFPGGVGYLGTVTNSDGVAGVSVTEQRTVLFRTDDNGRTWLPQAATGLPSPDELAFASATEGWAYAAGELYRSTDSGVTWTLAAPLPLAAGESLRPTTGGGLSAAPGGAALALAGPVRQAGAPCHGEDGNAILWSTDGGATWTQTRFPTAATGNGVLVNEVEAFDADSGVALTTEMTAGPSGCFASAEGNDVHVTDDAGATWTKVVDDAPGGRWVTAATMNGAGDLLVAWDDGAVDVSTDGGTTFTTTATLDSGADRDLYPVFRSEAFDVVTDVVFRGATGYATQSSGLAWRTNDGGLTWAPDGVAGSAGVSGGTRLAVFDSDHAFTVAPVTGAVTYRS